MSGQDAEAGRLFITACVLLFCFVDTTRAPLLLLIQTTSLRMPDKQTGRSEAGDGDVPSKIHPVSTNNCIDILHTLVLIDSEQKHGHPIVPL